MQVMVKTDPEDVGVGWLPRDENMPDSGAGGVFRL
jgi:hypothetical protein